LPPATRWLIGCPRLAGMRPLSLTRPSAWPWAEGPAAADRAFAGAGRGGPHRLIVAAACLPGTGVSRSGIAI